MSFRSIFIALTLFCLGLFPAPSGAETNRTAHILVLHSYHPGYPWSQNVNDGMQAVFNNAEVNLRFHVEYLDSIRHPDDYFQSTILKANLEYKLQHRQFDLVMVSDNKALEYVRRYRKGLFAGLPIVFCGINDYEPTLTEGLEPITGVAENPDFLATLQLIRRLHPQTKEIVVIGRVDNLTGRRNLQRLKTDIGRLQETWRYSFLNELLPDAMLPRVEQLKPGSVILLTHQPVVSPGETLRGHEVMAGLRAAAKVPIYSCWNHYFDPGIVGGKLIRGYDQGRWAAELALRVLEGEAPSSIPVFETGASRFLFDHRELEAHKIAPSLLPKGSEILFVPDTTYRLDKAVFWGGLSFGLSLVVLLFILGGTISRRRRAEKALTAERVFLQTVIDGVADPIMVVGLEREVLLTNEAAQQVAQKASRQKSPGGPLQCSHIGDGVAYQCGDPEQCPMEDVRRTGKAKRVVHRYEVEGRARFMEVDASPLWDEAGEIRGMIEASRDITDRLKIERQLRENQQRLNHLAYHDPLTDLPNRLLFHDRLERALLQAKRHGRQLSVLFLDLDRFKNVNDSLGHAVGDQLLSWVAYRLTTCVQDPDTVARLGGDEFVFILEEMGEGHTARNVAEKVREALSGTACLDGHELFVTASVGISLFPADAQTAEELVQAADAAMYQAKASGGDSFAFYSPELTLQTREQLFMESRLRKALDEHQFVLHYQPQVDLQNGHVTCMEALLRWEHPDEGMITPSRFIPLAEETGLIVPIGIWVLEEACRTARVWQQSSLAPLRVAVNMSARQFRQENLIQEIARILERTGLPAYCLEIEITESVLMVDVAHVTKTMEQLTAMGVSLAIDDFGAGYSSLGYLKRFPIDKIKIDRSFVSDLIHDKDDAAIVDAITVLARSLNLHVLAEGIETTDQLCVLQKKGCDFGQGDLFSPPVMAAEIGPLIEKFSVQDKQVRFFEQLKEVPTGL